MDTVDFLAIFQKGLAYQAEMPINWCPSCKIGLANEEVVQGKCERCGAETEKRKIKQWMLKITKYADRLIEDLNKVDYLEKIKIQQINWIGKSYGTNLKFKISASAPPSPPAGGFGRLGKATADRQNSDLEIEVFTTRVDTIFGVTAVVLAPEHPLIENLKLKIKNYDEVAKYIEQSRKKSDLERVDLAKEKTGVELKGVKIVNPLNGREVSLWVGDYVIAAYGGGSVMVVPAHDQRDFDFAEKYGLPILEVIRPISAEGEISPQRGGQNHRGAERGGNNELLEAFETDGILVNSGDFSGLTSEEARQKITAWLARNGSGGPRINYKLRDWIFSRQHYWGEPIPIIHCSKCGAMAVPEKDLPVELPYVEKYQPTGTGESPLAQVENWVKTKCPKCGGPARRETDTMPNWAGSSWYFLRYCDPNNNKNFADIKKLKYWLPVDLYNGGMEHTTLHLLYSRFWHKFLYDIGVVPTDEPYTRRRSHGMVLGEGGEKMSKSRGNVINPDEMVKKYGADALRVYEMFMGPFDEAIAWSTQGLVGAWRFLNRAWTLITEFKESVSGSAERLNLKRIIHQTIKKVSEDLDQMRFNTAVAALMACLNEMEKNQAVLTSIDLKIYLQLLAPFAPHISEELWHQIHPKLSDKKSVFQEKWPIYDSESIKEDEIELVIQINGRLRDAIKVKVDIAEAEAKEIALKSEKIKKYLADQKIKKVIFIPGKLINFVV